MKNTILICLVLLFSYSETRSQSIQEARKLTENEQYEDATTMYQALISKTPDNADLYYYYGENLLLSDNADSARIIFEKGSAINANNPLLKIGKAKLLIDKVSVREAKSASDLDGSNSEMRARYEDAQQNIKLANALIDEAILNTKDVNILAEAAEALIKLINTNTDKAKVILDNASKIDAKNIEVLLLFGDLYTELNNGTLGADYYNRALEQNPKSARAIVSKGRLYRRSTNLDGAAREFENAIVVDPSYAPAHRELGEIYLLQGKLKEGTAEYKKYLELVKNSCRARIRYATILYLSKSYAEAITELNQYAQRCDTNNPTMLRVYTRCYYETKDYDKGLNSVERLFKSLPMEKRIAKDFEFYGKLLIAKDNDSLGVEQLQRAFSLDPSRTDLLSEMAKAWMNLKRYDNAIQLLQQKIALGKDVKVQDYFMLGQAYYFNSQFPQADSAFVKASEITPKWASPYLYRAKTNTQIDTSSEEGLAKPHYEKYIEIALEDSTKPDFGARYNNGLIEAYGYLAYYYLIKKDTASAILNLEKKIALPLDPEEKKTIQDSIDRLQGKKPKNGGK